MDKEAVVHIHQSHLLTDQREKVTGLSIKCRKVFDKI